MKRPSGSVVILAAALGGLAVLYGTFGDTTLWGECLTVWPPLVWCVVFLPRLALIAWRRGLGEAAVGASLLVAFLAVTTEWRSLLPRPVAAREPFDRARRAGDPKAFRSVSWNVSGGLPLDDVSSLDPDRCLFQEAPFGDVEPQGPWARYRWIGCWWSTCCFRAADTRRVRTSPIPAVH